MNSKLPVLKRETHFLFSSKVYELLTMNHSVILFPENLSSKLGFQQILEFAAGKAYTPYGAEIIRKLKPSSNRAVVKRQLQQISEWSDIIREGASDPLGNLDDVRDILREVNIPGSSIALIDFSVILQNARQARMIKTFFDRRDNESPEIMSIVDRLTSMKHLEDAILKTINERGELRNDASPELKSIRGKINRERNNLRSTIQKVMRHLSKEGVTSDEGATIRNGRMVIPVQVEFKRKVDGFIHDISSSGNTVYLEPVEALQINNEIRQLEAEEQREIERIIRTLTNVVRKEVRELQSNIEPIALLDSIHCKYKTGQLLEGTVPEISEDDYLHLIRANNPNLLLKSTPSGNAEPVIPLDLELNQNELGLVITGPNAGGKSVAMKTVGLLQLMTQAGFPIPAAPDSKIPVINGLFVDMGDEQSIEDDLSTFSSRLNWMKQTLKLVERGALILIDEAGSGTDPEEGGALFQSFTEKMIQKNCRVIVTTHHGSLKVFAHETAGVINGAMEFNQENLTPTYRFKKGVPGSSYAFEIADRMDLPQELMQRARSLLGDKRDRMADLLISLEKKMQEAEDSFREYKLRLTKIENREREWKQQTDNLNQKRQKILETAYKDAEEIMKSANRRIEEAVEKVISEGRDNKEKIREARHEIETKKKEIKSSQADLKSKAATRKSKTDQIPVIGDFVLIDDSDTKGELVELTGKRATVLVNGMKIKSTIDKLTATSAPVKNRDRSGARSYTLSSDIDLSVKPRLDLRGKRGDPAINELTLYIDKAIARGINQVEIIHGKGEGILLNLVHDYLSARTEVKSFEIAPWESGGTGCTIVRL